MPISPDEAGHLARTAAQLVANAELTAMRAVARAIRAAAGDPTARPLESEAAKKARHLSTLRKELTRELRRLDADLAREVTAAVERAYQMGVKEAAAELQELTGGEVPLISTAQKNAVQILAADLHKKFEDVAPRVLREALDVYRMTAGRPVTDVALGVRTRRGGAQAMLDNLFGRGVRTFTDVSGRRWAIESYVEMAVRAGSAQALIAGHADELEAQGQELATIYGGAFSCAVCDQWIGQIVSVNGGANTVNAGDSGKTYPTLDYVRAMGWGHPNCRCGIGAYFPRETKRHNRRPNPEAYQQQQAQRQLERDIRNAKRSEALALTSSEARARRADVRKAQAALREHLSEHPYLPRLRYREQIGKVI